MAITHDHISSRVERARVRKSLQGYSGDDLHDRAVFWRIAIPGAVLFWACVTYGIYSVS
jgi:hypothetical protein